MNDYPQSQNDPYIPILMVVIMHKELKLSTLKITSGITLEEAMLVTQQLVNAGIIEFLSRSLENPSFRLINEEAAKQLLWERASLRMIME